MYRKQQLALLFLLATSFSGWTQVELGGETTPEKKETKSKAKREQDGSTEVYLVTNWSSTSSKLESNDPPFGDPLGQREFESSLNTWSFGIGFRNQVKRNFAIQAGVSFLRNGESYLYEDADSLFQYATTYSYIAMPIKGLYTYGEKLKFFAGGGITPQLFVSYRQEQEWKDAVNATGDEEIREQNGYASFAISAALNIGIQYQISDNWTFLFMPEYRIQLTDSYEVTDSYNHFGRAIGFDLGLTFKL